MTVLPALSHMQFSSSKCYDVRRDLTRYLLRVNLGEDYTKHEPGQMLESDQIGWGGVPPRGDT